MALRFIPKWAGAAECEQTTVSFLRKCAIFVEITVGRSTLIETSCFLHVNYRPIAAVYENLLYDAT